MLKYKVKIYKDYEDYIKSSLQQNEQLESVSTTFYPKMLNNNNDMIKLTTYELESVYSINDEGKTIDSLNDVNTFNFNTIVYGLNVKSDLIKKIMVKYGVFINETNCLYMIVDKHRVIDAHKMFVKCILEICSLFNN